LVAVVHPVVAEDVAVVPELLNDARRSHADIGRSVEDGTF
jgi:hypothetical protein